MTGNSSQQRKPHDTTPYATLRGSDAAPGEPKPPSPEERTKTAAESEFDAETDKLRQLRGALWAAFEAGPEAGLPNTLIDLTIAYTNALRLQLNLKAVSARQLQSKPHPAPRTDTVAKG